MCLPREHELPRVTADIFPHKRISLNEMPAVQSHVPGKPTEPSSLVFSATEKQTPVWFHLVLQSFILFFLLWEKKKKKMYVQCSIVRFVMKTKQKNPFHLCRVLMKVIPMWRVRASYSCGGSHSSLIHISVDFSRTAAITLPSRLYLSEVCIPVYLLLNHSVLALCLTALAINPLCVILLGLREIKEHWRAGLKLQPRAKYQFH